MQEAKTDAAAAINQRYVSPEIGVSKLRVKVSGLKATLSSRGKRNPLKKFQINPRTRLKKPPKSGIFARVLKSSGGFIQKAFIAKGGNVFERTGKSRLPIRKLTSVSAPGMLKPQPVISSVIRKLESNFARNLQAQISSIF